MLEIVQGSSQNILLKHYSKTKPTRAGSSKSELAKISELTNKWIKN